MVLIFCVHFSHLKFLIMRFLCGCVLIFSFFVVAVLFFQAINGNFVSVAMILCVYVKIVQFLISIGMKHCSYTCFVLFDILLLQHFFSRSPRSFRCVCVSVIEWMALLHVCLHMMFQAMQSRTSCVFFCALRWPFFPVLPSFWLWV